MGYFYYNSSPINVVGITRTSLEEEGNQILSMLMWNSIWTGECDGLHSRLLFPDPHFALYWGKKKNLKNFFSARLAMYLNVSNFKHWSLTLRNWAPGLWRLDYDLFKVFIQLTEELLAWVCSCHTKANVCPCSTMEWVQTHGRNMSQRNSQDNGKLPCPMIFIIKWTCREQCIKHAFQIATNYATNCRTRQTNFSQHLALFRNLSLSQLGKWCVASRDHVPVSSSDTAGYSLLFLLNLNCHITISLPRK